MKILIVDDNPKMRKVIAAMLNAGNNEIFELEDGGDAIEQYGIINPDWVLMDMKMKRMNGLEASKIIKKNYPDAHIAIVTNYDGKFYRNSAKKAGADFFLSKQNLPELRELLMLPRRGGFP